MLPLARLNNFVEQNHLFTQQSKILAAVSGGMDSVLMATLLHAAGYQVAIAHCNFNLRGDEALRDKAFCKQLAETLNLPFYSTNFNTSAHASSHKISIQMAARNLRYQWFEDIRVQNGFDVIALAHHQNDTIETILLNLTRGTGVAGLHGIRPRSGNLVRPMLFLTRDEVATIVKQNKLAYVEDSSNNSVKYARNKIRHEVIPRLKELNPNLEQTFQDHLQHFNELEQMLDMQLSVLKNALFTYHKQEIHLAITEIKRLKPLHLLLSGLLKSYGFNSSIVSDLIIALDKHAGRKFESAEWTLVVDRDKLIISPLKNVVNESVIINEADSTVDFGTYQLSLSKTELPYEMVRDANIAAVNSDLLIYPLTLRNWQIGDQFYPLGMKTRKKLSDFFIGLKVPLHQKETVPILVNGNNEIVWVAGLRVDNRYKITAGTKKISIFELTERK